jgi:nitroreductase
MRGLEMLAELLARRHSVRAFLPQPIPRDVIFSLVETAARTASWCNTQPWHLAIGSTAATDRFRHDLSVGAAAGSGLREIAPDPLYHGIYLERRRRCGIQLYESVGVARGDRAASAVQAARNFELFGAPHVAILSCDRALGPYGLIDCGAFLSSFMLAATSLNIGSIALASLAGYPEIVRQHFDIAPGDVIICGIALGLEATDDPANRFRTERAQANEIATWYD